MRRGAPAVAAMEQALWTLDDKMVVAAMAGLDTTLHHVILQPKHQLMTANIVHVNQSDTPGWHFSPRYFASQSTR
jgi:hypothetical protein